MNKAEFSRLYMELLPGLYRLALSILCNEAAVRCQCLEGPLPDPFRLRARVSDPYPDQCVPGYTASADENLSRPRCARCCGTR